MELTEGKRLVAPAMFEDERKRGTEDLLLDLVDVRFVGTASLAARENL